MAEHLLHDLWRDLPGGVTLLPSSGGVFEVSLGERLLFSKKGLDRFPDEGEAEGLVAAALGVEPGS